MVMISPTDVPHHKKVTYASVVCDYQPLKQEPYRCRLVVGGDKLPYASDSAAPAANLLESKILFNSTISQPGANFMTIDISNFFLSSTMPNPEFMKIHKNDIPDNIHSKYNSTNFMDKFGYVYFKIIKGMYGLKQAAILAYSQLKTNLEHHGYFPIPQTVGMWRHKTRKTKFCLCVDDFGIQYHSQADADHLIQALQNFYKITIDWSGKHYCGLTLDWDYENRFVDISMPGYITNLLTRMKHPTPSRRVDAPHAWTAPCYGRTVQHAPLQDMTPLLSTAATGLLQSAVGSLLFYARTVDPSMLPGLNEVSVQQSKPTEATQRKVNQLLDYVASHSNAVLRYHASAMVLHIDSDAAYLVLPQLKVVLQAITTSATIWRTLKPFNPMVPSSLNAVLFVTLSLAPLKLKRVHFSIMPRTASPFVIF